MRSISVGLIGFGTVGSGVVKIIQENGDVIKERLGTDLVLKKIVDLDITSPRPVKVDSTLLSTNIDDILSDPDIDIVIELIGGIEPAKTFILRALENGKHVVTANKALLAHHGNEIFKVAAENNVNIGFEASVGGGIPLIRSIREGLVAEDIKVIYGILNGTANYILTRMTTDGASFSDALKEAQEKGYAEADPTLDIEGHDTAHKLSIMCALSFGGKIEFDKVHIEGITGIDQKDIQFATEFGYKIKLLAIGAESDGKIDMRVHPTMIPKDHVLSSVDGAYNAVFINGNAVGNVMLYGLGAGMMPTGSAVISDVVDMGRDILHGVNNRVPALSFVDSAENNVEYKPISEIETRYYFRFEALDRPGVLSKISGILGENDISISAVIQKGRQVAGSVPIVMITHSALEKNVQTALDKIDKLDIVKAPSKLIRIENGEVD